MPRCLRRNAQQSSVPKVKTPLKVPTLPKQVAQVHAILGDNGRAIEI